MRIQLLSDLHLESQSYTLKNSKHADVIVLAGDICTLRQRDRLRGLLAATDFKPTVMVTGNHEYYGSSLINVDYQLGMILGAYPNVHLLNNSYMEIEGIVFAGGTLWTDFALPFTFNGRTASDPPLAARLAVEGISDFRHVRDLFPSTMLKHHVECFSVIAAAKSLGRPTVVVTHFLPSPQSVNERFKGEPLNSYFASDCEALMGDNVLAWLHGHTHCSAYYRVNGTQVVCNPRGYSSTENPAFLDECLIEVNP